MGVNVHFLNRVDWFHKQILNPYFCNMKTFEDRLSSENSFFLLAGPCAIAGEEMALRIAEHMVKITDQLGIAYIFKGSFKKANRSRIDSFTGIGDEKALKILQKVGHEFGVPTVTDIHEVSDAAKAAAYLALATQSGGMKFAWSRLFYLYGEGEDDRRLVPYIHSQLSKGAPVELTSGENWCDFLNVKEAGSQIANVTLNNIIGPLNICSGIPITVAKLAETIALKYNRPDLIKLGSIPNRVGQPRYLVGIPSLKKMHETS